MRDVIETKRLILRQFRPSDSSPYAAMCADPEVMRYLGTGQTLSALDAWRSFAFFVGHWKLLGYGPFAVEEKTSGRFIGRIGFYNPPSWPGFELGWVLARDSWGQGYATEGASAALRVAFEDLNRDHVISLIQPDNTASVRVAERIGETFEGKIELRGNDVLVYGIRRPETPGL